MSGQVNKNKRVKGRKQVPSSVLISDPAVKAILKAAGLDKDLIAEFSTKRKKKTKRN